MKQLSPTLKFSLRTFFCFFFLFVPVFITSSFIYAIPNVSGSALQSVDPGVLTNELSLPEDPSAQGEPPKPSVEQVPQTGIPDADKISFVLNEIHFTGNHVFSNEDLQEIFKPLVHQQVTLAQVEDLLKSITQKYRKEGYFLSHAIFPPQTIKDGKITIQIVEGFISQINIQDFSEKQTAHLKKYADALMAKKPLKYSDLERTLLLINDIVGFDVQSIVSPDPTTPQASIITLIGKHTPVKGTLSFDNYGTRYIGPNKVTATTSFNSLLVPGGTLALRYTTATHNKELQFFEASHNQALGTEGTHWKLGASHTDTRPQFTLSQSQVKGTSQNVFTNISHPFIRSHQETLLSNFSFNYANVSSSSFGTNLYNDEIRSATLGGIYEKFSWGGTNVFNINVSQGLNILGAPKQGPKSRLDAKSNFRKFDLSLSRNQFFDDTFSLFVMGTSQYTKSSLFASEGFIFGGPNLGRGYDAAQFLGDRGLAGKAEFRINTTPDPDIFQKVQYYAFYDAGATWTLNKPASGGRQSGASTGLGIRSVITPHFNFDVFVAKPLTTKNATQQATNHNGNAPLLYFQVSTTW